MSREFGALAELVADVKKNLGKASREEVALVNRTLVEMALITTAGVRSYIFPHPVPKVLRWMCSRYHFDTFELNGRTHVHL